MVEGMKRESCNEDHGVPTKYCDDCVSVRDANTALTAASARIREGNV